MRTPAAVLPTQNQAEPAAADLAEFTRRTAGADRLILEAYWQYFQEHAPDLTTHADPAFFQVMGVIYAASHECATPWQRAQMPHASLYLLRHYLEDLHPKLRAQLNRRITRNTSSMRWNSYTIAHRIQAVIDTFLHYHGLCAGHLLDAHVANPDADAEGPSRFHIVVHLEPELLLGDADGVLPDAADAWRTAIALAWVLEALLLYSAEVGLKPAAFW